MSMSSESSSVIRRSEVVLQAVTLVAILYSNYLVFMEVPNERVMGPVQRIFYFHVGSATASYCAFATVFVASLLYIANRSGTMDSISEAAGEVGFVFCTITLLSGMIWGHSAWNTWFSWEPRLVTFLLLWLIFLSFNLLRVFGDAKRIAMHSSVLGILGAVTVPIMVFSIKILPQSAQLHPQVIEKRGLDPAFQFPLTMSVLSLVLLQFTLVFLRARISILRKNF